MVVRALFSLLLLSSGVLTAKQEPDFFLADCHRHLQQVAHRQPDLHYIHPLSMEELRRLRVDLLSEYPREGSDLFPLVNVMPGRHGGRRLIVKRQGSWWDYRKDFNPGGGDLTQDLRFFPIMLGREAEFFGYRWLTDEHVMIPDIAELNGAIDAFNRGLAAGDPRRLLVKFYPTEDSFIPLEDYVRNFVYKSSIPISRNGRQFLHDMSSHAIEDFFLPQDYVRFAQARGKLWFDFTESLGSKYAADPLFLKALEAYSAKGVSLLAQHYDYLGMAGGDFLRFDSRIFLGAVGMEKILKLPAEQSRELITSGASGSSLIAKRGGVSMGLGSAGYDLLGSSAETFFFDDLQAPLLREFRQYLDAQPVAPLGVAPAEPDFALANESLYDIMYDRSISRADFEKALEEHPLGKHFMARLKYLREIAK
jgi:hypothetical protein